VRILVISNVYPPDVMGGYELCCRQTVDALGDRGHEVRVLTSAPRTPAPSEPDVQRTLRLTDIWSHYRFVHSASVTAHLAQNESHRINAFNVHALIKELETFKPDVVYLHMLIGLGGLGLLACLQYLAIPWVWQLGDDVPARLCVAAGEPLAALVMEYNRQIRGHYIAVSRQLANSIERAGIQLQGDLHVIPNWVVGPPPPPRIRYYHGDGLRVVAAASVIDRQIDKGIELAIDAAAILKSRGLIAFSLDIFGHVTDQFFPSLILKRGVSDYVTLKDSLPQEKLTGIYSDYDVFLFPTRPGEPFGVAPLEAGARGCVPLMSHTCGIAEWLVHGVHCLKSPRRADAFAASVETILDGTINLEPISRRASDVIRRDFHLDQIIVRIEDILCRAATEPRAKTGTPADAYRLAVLAEKLAGVLIQDSLCA
jgi:glycosyltransferase involved in cell wall biosynthesis